MERRADTREHERAGMFSLHVGAEINVELGIYKGKPVITLKLGINVENAPLDP